ncbi:MAG: hypothetical protein ACK5LR_03090 [Mangrovibacterium sp.]
MKVAVKQVTNRIQTTEINSLSLAILDKKGLLADSASEYLQLVLSEVGSTQVQLNNTIKEDIVRSAISARLADMKSAHTALYQLLLSTSLQQSSSSSSAKTLMEVIAPLNKSLRAARRQMVYHSHIKSLIAKLEESENFALLAPIMYAESALTRLKKAQEAFISGYAEYHDLRQQQVARASATQLRKQLLVQINQELVPYLNTSERMGVSSYDSFSFAVNAMIEDQNMLIKKRTTKIEESEGDITA